MEALSRAILRRELGLTPKYKKPLLDIKKLMYRLECREEDKFIVAENEDNFLLEQTPIYDMKFCPVHFHPHVLAVSDELGYISIVNTKEGESDRDKVVLKHRCHENALSSLDWSNLKDGFIASCSGDNTVKVWDIKKDFENPRILKGHTQTVKSVKFDPVNPECLTSSGRDGNIIFWDLRSGDNPCNIIRRAHDRIAPSSKTKDITPISVTDLVFHEEYTVISCGAKDGEIKFWDTRKSYTNLKKMIPISTLEWPKENSTFKGYTSLSLDQHNNLFASSCNEIFKFNLSSKLGSKEPATFHSPYKFASNYYVKFDVSRDGRFLISGSPDIPDVYVWDVHDSSPEPFLCLKSDSESTCVALFSPDDPLKIVCGSDDGRVHIWRPKLGSESDIETSMNNNSMSKSFECRQDKYYPSCSNDDNENTNFNTNSNSNNDNEEAQDDDEEEEEDEEEDGNNNNDDGDSAINSEYPSADATHLTKKQEEANKREAEIACVASKIQLKTLFPANGLFLTNLLEKNCHTHLNNNNNNDMDGTNNTNKNKKEFDLGSLLKDLPNFAIDGKHPSVPECSNNKKSTSSISGGGGGRKTCWLGELKLTLSSPSSPSSSTFNNNSPTSTFNVTNKRGNASIRSNSTTITTTTTTNNNNSSCNNDNNASGPSPGCKRLYSKISTAKDALQPTQQKPPKRIKLKLKGTPLAHVNTTPKRSPKTRINSTIRNTGRRNSTIDASGTLTSPNIMKYFSVAIQPIPFQLPTESS